MLAMAGLDATREPEQPGIEPRESRAAIAGHFRVTPTGEIVLEPRFDDIRSSVLTRRVQPTEAGAE